MPKKQKKNIHTVVLFQQDISTVIFSYLDLKDATQLRTTCIDGKLSVANYAWNDMKTEIIDILKWKTCFPNAKAAQISRYCDLG